MQPPHQGPGNAARSQGPGIEYSTGRVLDPIADGIHPMVQGSGMQDETGQPQYLGRLSPDLDRQQTQVGPIVVDAGGAQTIDILLAAGRIDEGHRMGHLIQADPLKDPGQPQAVIAMEMGQADDLNAMRRDAGESHLPLGALTGIEENTGGAPAQKTAALVAFPGGHEAAGA